VLHISRRGPEADEAKTLALVVSQRGTEYTLLVRALASREDLFVRLDRLWFVNDQDDAFSARLTAGATGTSVQVEGRLLPDDLLY
jgi:DNA-binding transcriptional regulator/RsmH inhibitor MraZ